jgi:Competence protein CoiA-like family
LEANRQQWLAVITRTGIVMVKYPVAMVSESADLVWVDEIPVARADRPKVSYVCVGCAGPVRFVAGSKRPHFAHKESTPNCAGESALHRITKDLIADQLVTQTNYELHWSCTCTQPITRVLNDRNNVQVRVEHPVGERRPDIAVLRDDRVRFVIEVVVTHEPESAALTFYEQQNIAVIIVRPSWETVSDLRKALALSSPKSKRKAWDEDLKGVEVLFGPPCRSDFHPNKKTSPCPSCSKQREALELTVTTGQLDCYKCHADVPLLDITDIEGETYGESDFKGIERIARQLGVRMGKRYSNVVKAQYMAHLCPKCGAFQGNFFVHHERNRYQGTSDARGLWSLHCDDCGTWEQLNTWTTPRRRYEELDNDRSSSPAEQIEG